MTKTILSERKITRIALLTQRPVPRRQFIPVDVLAIIRILAGRTDDDCRLITFSPEVKE